LNFRAKNQQVYFPTPYTPHFINATVAVPFPTNAFDFLSEVEVIEVMLLQMHIDFELKSRSGEHARVKKLEGEVHEIGKNFFDQLDTNRDAFLSRKEWSVFDHDEL